MTTAGFSRRQVLTVAGLTLGVGIVELGGPAAPASAAPDDPPVGTLTLEALPGEPVAVLSRDRAAPAACPRQLAVRVVNDGLALPAGTQVTVTFDQRLFAATDPAFVTLGGRRVAATSSTARNPATGATTCVVTLNEEVPARSAATGDLVALLGIAHPRLYPYDLVAQPAGAVAEMAATPRTPGAHRDLRPARPPAFGGPVTPWGVDLAGGWSRQTWGADDRYWYHYPVRVSIRGVGPARTPAVALLVAVDPRVVREITVASARLNDKPYPTGKIRPAGTSRTGGVHQAQWRTGVRLDPGDVLDLGLRVATLTPAGALETIKHPLVATAMGRDTAQRRTGLDAVTRLDSSWQ
ncbi:MAG: hypothetical protein HKP61_10755 [Dactylosporangium sp.]|nr:hypothetical protein [Dactylosporangium sp.]NNJ61409.1 hypothetical protein [Dactylosporangium sp.]